MLKNLVDLVGLNELRSVTCFHRFHAYVGVVDVDEYHDVLVTSTGPDGEFAGLVTVDFLLHLIVDLGLHLILQIERAHEYILVLRIVDILGGLLAIGVVAVNVIPTLRTLSC